MPEEDTLVTVFTDKDIVSPYIDQVKSKYKIAFLNECRSVHPFAYEWIVQVEDKFDFIVTHDADLLDRSSKYLKVSTGTSWLTDDESKIYEKNKLLSHIVSNKSWCRGHKLRHIIAEAIQNRYEVDLWGSAYTSFENKTEPLRDYYFSITVMNAKHNNYFTETLVDTFRCGTVPIFWGCDNVGEYFNEKGILKFNTGPELFDILDGLTENKYHEMLPYVKENFEIAKSHTQMDDLVWSVMLKGIKDRDG